MSVDTVLYDALEVPTSATKKEIQCAYSKITKKNHGNDEDLVSLSYFVLSNEDLRRLYDKNGLDIIQYLIEKGECEFEEEEEEIEVKSSKKKSIQTFELGISLKELYNGCTVPLTIAIEAPCSKCDGYGFKFKIRKESKCAECEGKGCVVKTNSNRSSPRICPECHGKCYNYKKEKETCKFCLGYGVEKRKKSITVEIPKGTHDGYRIEIPKYKSIRILVHQKNHSEFERRGDDLLYRKTISLSEAIVGTKFPLFLLDDRCLIISTYDLVIKPGMLMSIASEGFPKFGDPANKGDMYILFDVQFPICVELTPNLKEEIRKIIPSPTNMYDDEHTYYLSDSSIHEFGKVDHESDYEEEDYSDYADFSE